MILNKNQIKSCKINWCISEISFLVPKNYIRIIKAAWTETLIVATAAATTTSIYAICFIENDSYFKQFEYPIHVV